MRFKSQLILVICLFAFSLTVFAQGYAGFKIARLKYSGGGDWYNDPSAEINLLTYIAKVSNIVSSPDYVFVEAGSPEIFSYPFIFMTGHGNIVFNKSEAENLRNYLLRGGFVYVDDDYGINTPFRRELKKIFPEGELRELPFEYGLYNCLFNFPSGPPKIQEHDNKPPQGFGLFIEGRLAVYYTYESNPSDGWADAEVHKLPPDVREKALKFGANLVIWSLSN